jgi:hypothetical protein
LEPGLQISEGRMKQHFVRLGFQSSISESAALHVPHSASFNLIADSRDTRHSLVSQSCSTALRLSEAVLPHSRDLYVLDFVSRDGKRFDHDTQLDVYDVGVFGEEELALIRPQGSLPGRRGTVDLYSLNPGRTFHICRRNDQERSRLLILVEKLCLTLNECC